MSPASASSLLTHTYTLKHYDESSDVLKNKVVVIPRLRNNTVNEFFGYRNIFRCLYASVNGYRFRLAIFLFGVGANITQPCCISIGRRITVSVIENFLLTNAISKRFIFVSRGITAHLFFRCLLSWHVHCFHFSYLLAY